MIWPPEGRKSASRFVVASRLQADCSMKQHSDHIKSMSIWKSWKSTIRNMYWIWATWQGAGGSWCGRWYGRAQFGAFFATLQKSPLFRCIRNQHSFVLFENKDNYQMQNSLLFPMVPMLLSPNDVVAMKEAERYLSPVTFHSKSLSATSR